MNTIIYLRVSTDHQDLGLDVQLKQCTLFADQHKYSVKHIIKDENISGSLHYEERPGLMYALSLIKKDDIFLVSHLDRISRSFVVMGRIEYEIEEKRKAWIRSVAGEGTEGKDVNSLLYKRVMHAFAEHERHRINERIRSAMQEKKKNNEWLGMAPLGYKLSSDGIHIELDHEELKIIRKIKRLRKKGISIQKISNFLNRSNIFNRGKRWNKYSVLRRLYL